MNDRMSREEWAARGREQRRNAQPGAWVVRMIVSILVGALVGFLALFLFILGATIIGLDSALFIVVVGNLFFFGFGIFAGVLTFQGIKRRQNRPSTTGWSTPDRRSR